MRISYTHKNLILVSFPLLNGLLLLGLAFGLVEQANVMLANDLRSEAIQFTKQLRALELMLLCAMATNILTCVALAVFVGRSQTRRFSIIIDNVYRIASSENTPLNEPVLGKDEIAYLDKIIHALANSLEQNRANLQAHQGKGSET